MVGEDLPQKANRVDLDPTIRDFYGCPVPRITHSQHASSSPRRPTSGPSWPTICRAAPEFDDSARALVDALSSQSGGAPTSPAPTPTAHIMGTARMGRDPRKSVVDPFGRLHELDNVYVADGSVFASVGRLQPDADDHGAGAAHGAAALIRAPTIPRHARRRGRSGSNSTRLLVADVRDGAVHERDRRTRVTRLGDGLERNRGSRPPRWSACTARSMSTPRRSRRRAARRPSRS